MSSLRRNTVANLAGRVTTVLLWVLVTPFVLERLGPERFGIWALFFAFSAYLMVFDLGVGNAMIRFVALERAAGDRRALERTLGRGLRLALAMGLVWAAAVVLARGALTAAFHVPAPLVSETQQALVVFALGSLLLQPVQVLVGGLQGFERLDLSNACVTAGVAAHVGALVTGLSLGGDLRGVALAGVLGQAVTGLFAALLLRARLRTVAAADRDPGAGWSDLLRFGAALQITNTLNIVQVHVGKVMLGMLGALAMVADYELAFRVASGIAGLPLLILGAVAPVVTRRWAAEGPVAVGALYRSTLRWLYLAGALALGGLWVVAPDLTTVWLGPGYGRVADLIRLWVAAFALHLTWGLGAVFARSVGRPWIEVASLSACVAVNVGVGLWAIPRHGTGGALAALAGSYGTGMLVFLALAGRAGIPFGPWIRRELLPRGVLGAAVVAATLGLLSLPPFAGLLPAAGWVHGGIAGLLFVLVFALGFLPLGDPQRLAGSVREFAARVRRGGVAAAP